MELRFWAYSGQNISGPGQVQFKPEIKHSNQVKLDPDPVFLLQVRSKDPTREQVICYRQSRIN